MGKQFAGFGQGIASLVAQDDHADLHVLDGEETGLH